MVSWCESGHSCCVKVRGSREGWASHFLSRAIPFIIEFVSGSHVAELIQHQKVIDYTATYTMATTAIFGLLRPSTRITRGHTPPHGQTPSGPHTAAHGPALTSRACCAEPNGRDSIAAKPNGLALMLEHLDKARSGASPLPQRLTSATATPLKSPPHPLQMCRSNLSTTSLHLGGRLARSWSSHTRALVMRFLIMLSVPEGWWSGGCGVPALHLKRGERGRVPASRRAWRIV